MVWSKAKPGAIRILLLLVCSLAIVGTPAYAQDSSRVVYCSRKGTKYHYVKTCSGMTNPTQMTLGEAIAKGRKPCSNCVYDTPDGGGTTPTTPTPPTPPVPSGPTSIAPFTDIYSETPHSADVIWLYEKGVTRGWPEANGWISFRPYETVKRCDMAAFLYRLAGSPAFEPSEEEMSYFADVDANSSHAREIWWLASCGISEGWTESDGSHTFRGMDTVKRCDMAAFLKRLAGKMGGDVAGMGINPFSDVTLVTPHRDEVLWLVCADVTKGWSESDGSKTFRPYETVKRCDMAAFLHRLDNWCQR
mgnify:FL=1